MSSADKQFGARLRRLRADQSLSLADLASSTYVSRGWINNVEAGRRWPQRSWVEDADQVLGCSGALVAAWDAGEAHRQESSRTAALLAETVRESELLIASQPDAVDLDRLQQAVASLGVAYLANPADGMLKQGVQLRRELQRRLTEGAVRQHEVADLHVSLSRVTGVLAYAAVDLGHPDAAAIHAHTAFSLADMAGDNEMRAWARGTQSLITRFDKNYDRARDLIVDGLKYAGSGTSEIRLLCGAAQCAANLGDVDGALAFIGEAQRARERAGKDTVEGLFGFSPAKQAYYSGSSLMWLPDRKALTIAADSATDAIRIWEHEPVEQRSLDDEALAHVYLATARLKLGEIDGALEAVRPVIELPPERQISWIRKRVGELSVILEGGKMFHNSPRAAAVLAELRAYGDGA